MNAASQAAEAMKLECEKGKQAFPQGIRTDIEVWESLAELCKDTLLKSASKEHRRILERVPIVVSLTLDGDAQTKLVPGTTDEYIIVLGYRGLSFLRCILYASCFFAIKSSLDDKSRLSAFCAGMCEMFTYSFAHKSLEADKIPDFMFSPPLDHDAMLPGLLSLMTFVLGHEMGHVLQTYHDQHMQNICRQLQTSAPSVPNKDQLAELVSDIYGTQCVLSVFNPNRTGLLLVSGPFVALGYTSAMQHLLVLCEMQAEIRFKGKGMLRDQNVLTKEVSCFAALSDYPLGPLRQETILNYFRDKLSPKEKQFAGFVLALIVRSLHGASGELLKNLATCVDMLAVARLPASVRSAIDSCRRG